MIDDEASDAFIDTQCDECWGLSVIHNRNMLCAVHRGDVERNQLTPLQRIGKASALRRQQASTKERHPRTKEFL